MPFLCKESLKKTTKEPQIMTSIENSQNYNEITFLSSKDISQNITYIESMFWSSKKLIRFVNNNTKLFVDDNRNKNKKYKKQIFYRKVIESL